MAGLLPISVPTKTKAYGSAGCISIYRTLEDIALYFDHSDLRVLRGLDKADKDLYVGNSATLYHEAHD